MFEDSSACQIYVCIYNPCLVCFAQLTVPTGHGNASWPWLTWANLTRLLVVNVELNGEWLPSNCCNFVLIWCFILVLTAMRAGIRSLFGLKLSINKFNNLCVRLDYSRARFSDCLVVIYGSGRTVIRCKHAATRQDARQQPLCQSQRLYQISIAHCLLICPLMRPLISPFPACQLNNVLFPFSLQQECFVVFTVVCIVPVRSIISLVDRLSCNVTCKCKPRRYIIWSHFQSYRNCPIQVHRVTIC